MLVVGQVAQPRPLMIIDLFRTGSRDEAASSVRLLLTCIYSSPLACAVVVSKIKLNDIHRSIMVETPYNGDSCVNPWDHSNCCLEPRGLS